MLGKTLLTQLMVRLACTSITILSLVTALTGQDCYTVTNANNGHGDSGLNGYYEFNGTQYGCQKFIKVAELNGNPSSATYGVERMYGYFWSLVRKSDNVMRYMKVTSNCTIPNSGYTPCCNQGGNPAFTLVGENSCAEFVLPVELVSFNVHVLDEMVLLQWQTASETNNDGFEIQRSQNGKDWRILDFLPGHGTSTLEHNYSWEDRQPLPGSSYYRLRQRDFDGSIEYSKVLSVNSDKNPTPFTVFPNPTKNQVTILTGNAQGTLLLSDLTGKVIRLIQVDEERLSLDLTDIPEGIYFLSLRNQYGWLHQEKLVVTRK